MAKRESETTTRVLEKVKLGEFTLLNHEKVARVLDLIEGVVPPRNADEAEVLKRCLALKNQNKTIIALYDRLGGAIKIEGRKIALGTFYDFAARAPKAVIDLGEDDYEDEYVLVRKKVRTQKEKDNLLKSRLKSLDIKGDKVPATTGAVDVQDRADAVAGEGKEDKKKTATKKKKGKSKKGK